MKSDQMIDILKFVISTDLASPTSVIGYFLNNNMRGGWEAWLQVAYARAVVTAAANPNSDYDREKNFGVGNGQKCDLWFQLQAAIWVELKTQRNLNYANAVSDFSSDIGKLIGLPRDFREKNMLVAAAVLTLGQHGVFNPSDDRASLNAIRNRGPRGRFRIAVYNSANRGWIEATNDILNVPLGRLVLGTFVADIEN